METNDRLDILTFLKESQLAFSKAINNNIIERCFNIVEVGGLTVGTDENGVIIAQNVQYPMQFTRKAVDSILAMSWKNGNKERIKPVVYERNDWFKTRLKMVEESIALLENH